MFMVDDAVFLVEHGVLKNLSNVGAMKNRAAKAIPEYPGFERLCAVLKAARTQTDSKQPNHG
jgi:hypothetical protein